MPASSKAQQKFMGAVYALKKGDIKPSDVTPAIRQVAKDMKQSDAKDFASTKHKGLPKKVKKEILNKLKEYANKMGRDKLGGDDYTSKRRGGLRDFDGYDNVDYNKDMPMDEGMFSTIDQIRQDSKNVRDFVKNVFKDREFKKMSNDKDFIKYLKSIYEGTNESKGVPQNYMSGRTSDYHTALRGKNRDYSKGTNFKKKNHGQPDIENEDEDQETNQLSNKQIHVKAKLKVAESGLEKSKKNYKDWKSTNKKENVAPNHNDKSAPYGSGYKKTPDLPTTRDHGQVEEGFDKVEHLSLLNKALRAIPGSQKQKDIIRQLNKIRKSGGMRPLKEKSIVEYGQKMDLSYIADKESKLDGTPEDKMAIDEIGLFPIQNYLQGIIPSNFIDTTTRQKKERLRSTLKDLKNTLNYFWKQHKIPYRIK